MVDIFLWVFATLGVLLCILVLASFIYDKGGLCPEVKHTKKPEWQIDIIYEYKINDIPDVFTYNYNTTSYNPSCYVFIEDVYDQIRYKNSHIVLGNALCVFLKPEEVKYIWIINTIYLENLGKLL